MGRCRKRNTGGGLSWISPALSAVGSIASAINYKPTGGTARSGPDILGGLSNGIVGIIPELIKWNKDKNTVVSGSPGAYASGGPIDSLEVKKFDSSKLKAVQLDLKNKGLYSGKVDGIYGPLTEKAIAGYNRTAQGITLPEFTVISSNNKEKLKTLRHIQKAEELYGKPIYRLWEMSNKPSITASATPVTPHYNPLRNEITLQGDADLASYNGTDALTNKVKNTLLEDPAHFSKEKYKRTEEEFFKVLSNPPKDLYIEGYYADLIPELAHSYQRRTGRLPLERGVEDWVRNPYISQEGQQRQYEMQGSLEHEAHSIIEPKLKALAKNNNFDKNYKVQGYQTGGPTDPPVYAPVMTNPITTMVTQPVVASPYYVAPRPHPVPISNWAVNDLGSGSSKSKSRSRFRERQSGGPIAPNYQTLGHITFDSNKANPNIAGYIEVTDENTGSKHRVVRNNDGSYNWFSPTPRKNVDEFIAKDFNKTGDYISTTQIPDQKSWLKNYVDSDKYTERLNKEGISDPKKENNTLKSAATGGSLQDTKLSSNAFQVRGNPNVTDGNTYPQLNAKLDHGEVMNLDKSFVFSEDLKDMDGKSFASKALNPNKAIGRAEKVLSKNPYDEQAKKTIEHSERILNTVATRQEKLAQLLGLRNDPSNGYVAGGFTQGDPTQDPFLMYKGYHLVNGQWVKDNPNKPIMQFGPVPSNMRKSNNKKSVTVPPKKPVTLGPNHKPIVIDNGSGLSVPTDSTTTYQSIKTKNAFGEYSPSITEEKYPNNMITPEGDTIDLNELGYTPPAETPINVGLLGASENQTEEAMTIPEVTTPSSTTGDNSLSKNNELTLGDYLQFAEVGSKFFQTLRGPEKEKQLLDTTPVTRTTYDPRPTLAQNNRTFQNFVNTVDTPSINLRRSLINNLYANKINQDSQVRSEYDRMNKQGLADYENRLSNQRRYNIQSAQYTNNLNAANRGAYDSTVQNAFTSLGNLGEALNRRKYGYDYLNILKVRYPQVYESLIKDLYGNGSK